LNNLNGILEALQALLVSFGLNLLAATAIALVGKRLARIVSSLVPRLLSQSRVDPTIISFAETLTYYGLLGFVVLAVLNRLGVETASIIALLGAAGLAVGLALQGSLSNFAAGVLMVVFRPFSVGDYISVDGTEGTVEAIQLLTTTLVGLDNTVSVVPNSTISNSTIVNYTRKPQRRIDGVVGISYGDDIAQARQVILTALSTDPRVLSTPAPSVVVLDFGDSSVNLGVRPWVRPQDYWAVSLSMYELIKRHLDEQGITIPFPQRDVHLFPQPGAAPGMVNPGREG